MISDIMYVEFAWKINCNPLNWWQLFVTIYQWRLRVALIGPFQ